MQCLIDKTEGIGGQLLSSIQVKKTSKRLCFRKVFNVASPLSMYIL